MKNWPLVQKARTIMARPEMSPNHHRSFACRCENAPISQKTPIVRKMKPRMSATAAQVMPVSSQSHQRLAIWRKGSGGVVSVAIAMRGMITQGPDGGRCRRSGGRELVDHAGEQAPESLDGGDAHALVGRVRRFDLRAERDHVQARHPLADDGRLEPGVYRCDDRGMAEQPLVDAAGSRARTGGP